MKNIFVIILIATNSVTCDIDVLFDFEKFYEYLKANLSPDDNSSRCSSELTEILENNDTLYDLYDATSKYPWNGLKGGSKKDWGNYDQCINIDHAYSEGKILGKYCLNGLSLLGRNNEFYYLAICMPSGCTANDYNTLFNTSVSSFNDVICHTKDYVTKYTAGDIAMIVVFLVFATCIVISTTYDLYLYKTEQKTAHPLYVAFSAFTNLKKLLQTSEANKEQIQIFNGLKSVFMMWVISFHAMGFWQQLVVSNDESVVTWFKKLRAVYVFSALLGVDGFFFMSGFLQAYGYLKQKHNSVILQIVNIPSLILHRYIRLTPAMAMTYFTYITLFRHIASGPFVKILDAQEFETCRQNWLPFFLYYQNYHNNENLCLGHTWYLSVDMQLFVISPIILIPVATLLARKSTNFKPVMYLLLVINVFAMVMPIAAKLLTNISDIYDHQTHFRLSVYAMGIMMGTFMREKKGKPFLNSVKSKSSVNLGIWIIVLNLMAITALLYQNYSNSGYSENVIAISHILLRPIWCLGLCWMIYSSYHGYGGIINWILTRPTLQITTKASYCMYIMHWLVLMHYLLMMRTRLFFHDYIAFINFCGFFVVTFAVAIIWCISFESPMITIEKLIFGGGIRREKSGGEQKDDIKIAVTSEQPVPKND